MWRESNLHRQFSSYMNPVLSEKMKKHFEMLFDNIDLVESYSHDLIKQSMELSKTAANFRKQSCMQIRLTGTDVSWIKTCSNFFFRAFAIVLQCLNPFHIILMDYPTHINRLSTCMQLSICILRGCRSNSVPEVCYYLSKQCRPR